MLINTAKIDFPENQLGASLKGGLDNHRSQRRVLLPREPTRGLIEGSRSPRTSRQS